jgi:hypothetical protein
MGSTISLSLVSHTNVGKTTLARTLLGQDIGEVRDAAHVTQVADGHPLLTTPDGDRLELWDTPGFGDSVRLARRLAQAGNPIGWFLTEVWDRFKDRAFWSSQKAIRHVVDRADVVLYLVNASEPPEDAAYLDAELQVLRLLHKPVVVLLNQLGQPAEPAVEAAEVQRWRSRLAVSGKGLVSDILPLDAFARGWLQEGVWLDAVQAALLPVDTQQGTARLAAMARLKAAWWADRHGVFRAAMDLLADRLVAAAVDREPVLDEGIGARLKAAGSAATAAMRGRPRTSGSAEDQAMGRLTERLQAGLTADTDQLIALHRLDGRAAAAVRQRMAAQFAVKQPVDEGKAAILGGVVAGALTGLKADIATGGLTLGGGMLAGGLLGALGAAGAARGVNVLRGQQQALVTWRDDALQALLIEALLAYLAVAHHGRGRGSWADKENPAFWAETVRAVVDEHRGDWLQWLARRPPEHAASADAATTLILTQSARPMLQRLGRTLLQRLYPAAPWRSPGDREPPEL